MLEQGCPATGYGDSSVKAGANGAKTGAIVIADSQLAWLNEVWSTLPEDVRAEVLDVVARAGVGCR